MLALANFLKKSHRLLLVNCKASYYRPNTGKWPEPLTQQTLAQFLEDANYFEVPRKLLNIGLDVIDENSEKKHGDKRAAIVKEKREIGEVKQIDEIIKLLAVDAEIPPLDLDDICISRQQLVNMAINSGIYRDLFTHYQPNRNDINFTQQQADNLDRLIPHHWITDQPYARVNRSLKEPPPLPYFEPVIGISARFVKIDGDDHLSAHTAYYGNIVPACEALTKPSVTLNFNLSSPQLKGESKFNNWSSGYVEAVNCDLNKKSKKLYTLALLNLDSIHENNATLHWMISNLEMPSIGEGEVVEYDELCKYLPVHGIRGFGYSRFVFLLFEHENRLNDSVIDDFSLEKRKFDAANFLSKHQKINIKPTGLSWFQTTWDISSNDVFHNYINQKAPVFEHVQTKLHSVPEKSYPGRKPFHLYLDHYREKKSINEQVLLERLKSVDPTDYKDQYVPPAVPPTVFVDKNLPSWMTTVMFKKKNKIGYWRGLRPVSKLLPLENNVDLDYPIRPVETSLRRPPEYPNHYLTKKNLNRHIVMPYKKPASEQESIIIQDNNLLDMEQIKSIMKEYVVDKKKK